MVRKSPTHVQLVFGQTLVLNCSIIRKDSTLSHQTVVMLSIEQGCYIILSSLSPFRAITKQRQALGNRVFSDVSFEKFNFPELLRNLEKEIESLITSFGS